MEALKESIGKQGCSSAIFVFADTDSSTWALGTSTVMLW